MARINAAGQAFPVKIEASSEGSWANGTRLASRLASTHLPASAFSGLQSDPDPFALPGGLALIWDTGGVPDTLQPGDVLRLQISMQAAGKEATQTLLFPIAAARMLASGQSGLRQLIAARAWRVDDVSPDSVPAGGGSGAAIPAFLPPITDLPADFDLTSVERLRFEMVLREPGSPQITLTNLAFCAPHIRFWGDVVLSESSPLFRDVGSAAEAEAQAAERYRERMREARKFGMEEAALTTLELSGRLAPVAAEEWGDVYLPLNMPAVSSEGDFILPAVPGSDDLDTYPPERFLDTWLTTGSSTAAGLYQNAQDRVYIQGRRLRGMHSLMFTDEAAMLALPDSVHPEWQREIPAPTPAPIPLPVPPPTDPGMFAACAVPTEADALPTASSSASEASSGTGNDWQTRLPLILEDAIFGSGEHPIDVEPVTALRDSMLARVQSELQKLCEARRDMTGILSLPAFYEKRHCLLWQQALRLRLGLPPQPSLGNDTSGLPDLSYVAAYHPWMQIADGAQTGILRAVPPDGAACGTIAARERARGVWVAPANIPLVGVLSATPLLAGSDQADLFVAGFNLLRSEPRDFRFLSAHTLSDERDWLQISVRRLMIVLRKMLLERGSDYVFENNSPHFREAVRLSLESALRTLFANGAFAGRTAEGAYRVVTDASVNTPASVDAGQFIVEVRVAPSQPMEFLTIRLIRAQDNLLTTTER